jgi:hypothetical protein
MPSIDRAFKDKRLFAAGLGDLNTWLTWLTILCAAFAVPLSAQQLQTFAQISGGRLPPSKVVRELWVVAGRRSGKSRIAALIAIFLALFIPRRVAPGERPMVLVIAGSIDQAATVFEYVKGFLDASGALAKEVVSIKRHEILLRNGITVAVHSNSFRTVRGRTLIGCVFDETAWWRDESSASPDIEMYRSILPSLVTQRGMLVAISSPYRKIGLLHQKHRDFFGQNNDEVLVVQGASKLFNPSLDDAAIAQQRLADPTAAPSEWDALFRTDISSFLDDALIDGAVEHGRPLELPPRATGYYRAFCDASGGTGNDSYTVSIGHKQDGQFVIDVIRGTPPGQKFDPVEVTKSYAALCREYRCYSVSGDYYGAEWVASAWRNTGVTYIKSELPKSQLYLECIPLFTRGLVRLPDHAKLLRELRLLERHTHRSGKDTVDHPRNGSDDYANSVCGCLRGLAAVLGAAERYRMFDVNFVDEDAPQQPAAQPEPPRCDDQWWRSMPRSTEKIPAVSRYRF